MPTKGAKNLQNIFELPAWYSHQLSAPHVADHCLFRHMQHGGPLPCMRKMLIKLLTEQAVLTPYVTSTLIQMSQFPLKALHLECLAANSCQQSLRCNEVFRSGQLRQEVLTIADCDDDANNIIRARCLELGEIRLDSSDCRCCRAGIS